MDGVIKSTAHLQLGLLLSVFLLGFPTPQRLPSCSGNAPPRDRTAFVCTTLAAALVLCFIHTAAGAAADGGGESRLLRGLLLLGIALSAAFSVLFFQPAVVTYRLGCYGHVGRLALAGATFATAAVGAGLHVVFAKVALFDRD